MIIERADTVAAGDLYNSEFKTQIIHFQLRATAASEELISAVGRPLLTSSGGKSLFRFKMIPKLQLKDTTAGVEDIFRFVTSIK